MLRLLEAAFQSQQQRGVPPIVERNLLTTLWASIRVIPFAIPILGNFLAQLGIARLISRSFATGVTQQPIVVAPFSAPTHYDEQTFLHALFDHLLITVRARLVHDYCNVTSFQPLTLNTKLFIGISTVAWAATVAFLGQQIASTESEINVALTSSFIALFGALLLVSLAAWIRGNYPSAQLSIIYPHAFELYNMCDGYLERLAYHQKLMSSSTTEISSFSTVKIGTRDGVELTRWPYTLVTLIQDIRAFAIQVSDTFGKIYIGVDELDKINDTVEFRSMLRGIKGIFGIPGVCYVLTVSDEALRSFHLRRFGMRDELDSAFREIINIEPLSITMCARVLRRRNVELGSKQLRLLSIMAGDNTRELMRLTYDYLQWIEESDFSEGVTDVQVCARFTQSRVRLEISTAIDDVRIDPRFSDDSTAVVTTVIKSLLDTPLPDMANIEIAGFALKGIENLKERIDVPEVVGLSAGVIRKLHARIRAYQYVVHEAPDIVLASDDNAMMAMQIVRLAESSPVESGHLLQQHREESRVS